MSRRNVWESDIAKARDHWKETNYVGDYEIYAMACAAFLSSKEFNTPEEHWFCGDAQTRSIAISSLIMFSFTLPEDSQDPANQKYKEYEAKFTTMLASCQKCAVDYQCCDSDLMNELIDEAGISEKKVLFFFKELHRKDRARLAEQLKVNKNSVPVLTEVLWSFACMTVSSFVNDNLVTPNLLVGASDAVKHLPACPGLVMLSFMPGYELRQSVMHRIMKPENVQGYIDAWKLHPTKFKKMFSHGLKRNIQAEHLADFAWFTASLLLNALRGDSSVHDDITTICMTEMKSARGVPKFGAHLLFLQILKLSSTVQNKSSQQDVEDVLDYITSFSDLKMGIVDPRGPEAAQSSKSYRDLSGAIVTEWFRLYVGGNPSTVNVAKRLSFLLGLKQEAFKSKEEYNAVSRLAVKTASVFSEPEVIQLVLGTHGSRVAEAFTSFKPQWISKLWKLQVEGSAPNEWLPFWDALSSNSNFGQFSVEEESSGTAVGILQGSKDVALKYRLPSKSQKPASSTANSASANSTEPSKCEKLVKSVLESLTDTAETDKLLKILLDKYVLRSVLLLSVSGNRSLGLSAEEFMKQAVDDVDEDSGRGYVHYLVKNHTELLLTAVNAILADAEPADATWLAVMPGLIKLALTVLDQVYSIHDGVETTGNKPVLNLLYTFWNKSWAMVAHVIKSIRTWAKDYAVSHVKIVLINVLDFSQGLLSKFRLLDADLSSGGLPNERSWGAVLADPAIACVNNMGDMLQLAIPELLAMSVSIIIEILGLMNSFHVTIPDTLLSLLEGLATKRLNSKLSKDQLRELLSATDLGEDEITDMIENHKSKLNVSQNSQQRAELSSQSSQQRRTVSSSQQYQQHQHQQMSIGDFFKSSGENRPQLPQRIVTNNQIQPQTQHQQSGLSMIKAQLSKQQHHPASAGGVMKGSAQAHPHSSHIGPIYPERPPGFNPQKPHQKLSQASEDDDDDDDDDDISALSALGAQKKREEAANKLREAYEQSKNRASPQIISEVNSITHQRMMQRQKDIELKNMKARLNVKPTRLHYEILGWDYFATSAPIKAPKLEIPDKFNNSTQYQDIMSPLLYLEAWEQVSNARYELEKNKQSSPVLLIFGKRVKVDSFTDVYVSVAKESFKEAKIGESDLLTLFYDKARPSELCGPDPSLPHCFARVKEGTIKNFGAKNKAQFVDFQIRLNDQSGFLRFLSNGANVSAVNLGSMRTVEREFTALMALPYYDLVDQILSAKPTISHDQHNQIQRFQNNLGLNRSQATAVSRSISNQGFTLIQGPPGTGKTKTIMGIIGAYFTTNNLVSHATGQETSATKRILVCAPSNAAVDEIVLRLKKGVLDSTGKHQNLNILRMGRLEMISEEVQDVTLDYLMSKQLKNSAEPVDEQLRNDHTALTNQRNEVRNRLNSQKEKLSAEEVQKLTDKLKDLGRELREKSYALDMQRDRLEEAKKQNDLRSRQQQNDILTKAQVVCTTLSASAHPLLATTGITFDTVIVDEAAQCIELSALIPLKYGCKNCILVGDPNQLPPTVVSQEAGRLKYEQSLFVRMFNQYKDVEGAVCMLDTQFRMHPEISKFPSREFYSGLLKDADGLSAQLERPWHKAHKALGPYTFFEIQGKEQRGGGGRSFRNTAEAYAALALVKYILKEYSDDLPSIGVISPYREQVVVLRDVFRKDLGMSIASKISFNSIDGFQGQEKEIIIMSCVRATDEKRNSIGFLADVRRMNVAITRAKSSLWVLGHSHSLVANSVWRNLIEDARERNRFVSSTSQDIMKSIQRFDSSGPSTGALNYDENSKKRVADVEHTSANAAKRAHMVKPLSESTGTATTAATYKAADAGCGDDGGNAASTSTDNPSDSKSTKSSSGPRKSDSRSNSPQDGHQNGRQNGAPQRSDDRVRKHRNGQNKSASVFIQPRRKMKR